MDNQRRGLLSLENLGGGSLPSSDLDQEMLHAMTLRDLVLLGKRSNAVWTKNIEGFGIYRVIKDRSALSMAIEYLAADDVTVLDKKLTSDDCLLYETDGRNAMHIAFMRGDVPIVRFLLEKSSFKDSFKDLLDIRLYPMPEEMVELFAHRGDKTPEEFTISLKEITKSMGNIQEIYSTTGPNPMDWLASEGNSAQHKELLRYLWVKHQDILQAIEREDRPELEFNYEMDRAFREVLEEEKKVKDQSFVKRLFGGHRASVSVDREAVGVVAGGGVGYAAPDFTAPSAMVIPLATKRVVTSSRGKDE